MASISLGNLQSDITMLSLLFLNLFSRLAIHISSWKLRRHTSVPQYCSTHLGVSVGISNRSAHHGSTCSRHSRASAVRPSSRVRSQPNTAATESFSVLANDSRLNSWKLTRKSATVSLPLPIKPHIPMIINCLLYDNYNIDFLKSQRIFSQLSNPNPE